MRIAMRVEAMRLRRWARVACVGLGMVGMAGVGWSCQEPNYRTDIRANGEGGVDVHREPLDDSPGAAPAAGVSTDFAPPPVETRGELQGRLDDLKAQDARLRVEIGVLQKRLDATATTRP